MARRPNYNRDIALGQALGLFWEKGYHGSSMKQIEQALDMRPGSIYATFGSKDGLYSEALALYAQRGGQELAAHMARYDSILSGLKDYLRTVARSCADKGAAPSRACMIVKTLLEATNTHSGLSEQAQGILSAIEQSFEELLARAQQRGELTDTADTRRLARLLQSQIMGLRAMAERDLTPGQLEALGEDMARILDTYQVH